MKKFLNLVLVLLVANVCVKATPINTLTLAGTDKSLVSYLQQPNVIAADPAVTAMCFSQYLPQLSEIANIFSQQYEACVTLASEQTVNLTTTGGDSRADYTEQANNLCNSYQTCNNETDTLAFFDCYAAASNNDISAVYDISNGAAGAALAWTNGLQTIKTDQDQCTNATRNTYVTQTAATYHLLDICLETGSISTQTGTPTAGTDYPSTLAVRMDDNIISNDNSAAFKIQCSNGTGTHTQTSADGSQTQTQTGPGCQTQDSGSGTQEQSQSGSGTQSQSQCSGTKCDSLFPPMEPMQPMQPMQPMKPMEPMSGSIF